MVEQTPVTEISIDRNRLENLRSAAGSGPVLILTHINPDPDALAAGKALATLFRQAWGLQVRLQYSGLVVRAENKMMLEILTPEWEYSNDVMDKQGWSAIALIDSQPTSANNNLPDHILPDIVFDHHRPLRPALDQVRFFDVRTEMGATVTMIYQYLHAAGVKPDPILATAIFYGIQTDTRGLSGIVSALDQQVYLKMLGILDHSLLTKVQQAGLPGDYFRIFDHGLHMACIYNRVIIVDMGEISTPDHVAEIADLLIRHENACAVLCLGYLSSTLHLSLRTKPEGEDAGILIQRVVLEPGKAGGHGAMAGGQIPLKGRSRKQITMGIKKRFLETMGENGKGVPLLPGGECVLDI